MRPRSLSDLAASADALAKSCDQLAQALPAPGDPVLVGLLRSRLGEQPDFRCEEVHPGRLWAAYLDAMVDRERYLSTVVRAPGPSAAEGWAAWRTGRSLSSLVEAEQAALAGHVLLTDGGSLRALDLASVPGRPVDVATTEKSVVGPKEAFVERIATNIALIRLRLPTRSLRMEQFVVGRRSRTRTVVFYLGDVVQPGLADRLGNAIRDIETDTVRNVNDIGEWLFGGTRTMFPLAELTERPDRVAHGLSDGRAAVMVDGAPFALLVPTTLWEFQRDDERALPGPLVTLFIRVLRVIGSLAAVFGPGFYVATLSLNTGVLWPQLALTLVVARNGIPYPVLTETLIMCAVVDIFAEATASAPGGIGNAISIVGTLIIGEISVAARLASELLMIVVASSALGAFLTLKYEFSYALRLWKYPIVLLSAVAGYFGWASAAALLALYLAGLRSFGVPYLAPAAPLNLHSLLGHALARPLRPKARMRPAYYHQGDPTRRGS